jgi:hypothetical protein
MPYSPRIRMSVRQTAWEWGVDVTSTRRRVLRPAVRCRARDLCRVAPYWSSWEEYRRIRRAAVKATLIAPLALVGLAEVASYLRVWLSSRGWSETGFDWWGPVLFTLVIVGPWLKRAIVAPSAWTCPRCLLPFLNPRGHGPDSPAPVVQTSLDGAAAQGVNPFWYVVQLCVHCGLPKWAPNDPDDAGAHKGASSTTGCRD